MKWATPRVSARSQSMSFGRPVQYGKFGYPDAMVMRMNTKRGESGGPVFNNSGRLAGMVVSTLSTATASRSTLPTRCRRATSPPSCAPA